MRINSIEVENWRGVGNTGTLSLRGGLNILEGPNESGKSSLREALRHALLTPPKTKKKDLLAVRPWDTPLYPRVKVAFELGGASYEVEKAFFKTKNLAELKKDGRLVAQDDQVQPMLDEALREAGQWIDVLWGTQGTVAFSVDEPDALRSRLAAAAREAVTPGIAWLEEQLEKEYEKYWTPTGRVKKPISDLNDLETKAQTTLSEVQRQLLDSNERSVAAAAMMTQVEAARGEEETMSKRIEDARRRLEAWTEYSTAAAHSDAATQKRLATESWLTRWTRLVTELNALREASRNFTHSFKESEASLGTVPTRSSIESMQAELAYLQALERHEVAARLHGLKIPDAAAMARLQHVDQTIASVESALNMGAVQATLKALSAIEPILERDGEEPEGFAMAANTQAEFDADQFFALELPGVARLEVKSGNAQVQEQMARLSQFEEERTATLERFEAASLQAIQERLQEASELRGRLGSAPLPDLDAVRVSGLDSWSAAQRSDRLAALPAMIAQAENDHQSALTQWHKRNERHQLLLRDDPSLRFEGLRNQAVGLLDESRAFGVSIDFVIPTSLDEWSAEVMRIAEPVHALMQKQGEDIERLKAAAVRPEGEEVSPERLNALDATLKQLRENRALVEQELNRTLGALSAQGDLYGRVVAAEEAHERAKQKAARELLEGRSVKLLRQALLDAKDDLQRDVVAPLQQRVGARLNSLTLGRYHGVQFGSEFGYDGVVPAMVAKAAIDDLSFGTREQLVFLTRLCLGEMLSETGEAQVVVFDDNLVHTDLGRMAAACDLLADVAQRLQLLVFTCHPERYVFADGLANRIIVGQAAAVR